MIGRPGTTVSLAISTVLDDKGALNRDIRVAKELRVGVEGSPCTSSRA